MDRQGKITPAGVSAFENDQVVSGAMAVHVHINDDEVKIDLRIVDEGGQVLAEWEGVNVIDDSQVTWCFSDTGNIRLTMEPIIES